MSANIYMRQVKPIEGESLSCGAPSAFMASMREAFHHELPLTLTEDDIPVLRGMAAVHGSRGDNPYLELIAYLERVKTVEVCAVY